MSTGLEHLTLEELDRLLHNDPENAKAASELARRWMASEVTVRENTSHYGRPAELLV